jgi:hypothetical protein
MQCTGVFLDTYTIFEPECSHFSVRAAVNVCMRKFSSHTRQSHLPTWFALWISDFQSPRLTVVCDVQALEEVMWLFLKNCQCYIRQLRVPYRSVYRSLSFRTITIPTTLVCFLRICLFNSNLCQPLFPKSAVHCPLTISTTPTRIIGGCPHCMEQFCAEVSCSRWFSGRLTWSFPFDSTAFLRDITAIE